MTLRTWSRDDVMLLGRRSVEIEHIVVINP